MRAPCLCRDSVLISKRRHNASRELGEPGNLRRAMNALEIFLDFAPSQDEEREAESLLKQIKSSLN